MRALELVADIVVGIAAAIVALTGLSALIFALVLLSAWLSGP